MRANDGKPVPAGVPPLGPELRLLREARGLTQSATARKVGLSARSAVADYESGRRIPPDDILANYELAFGLEPGALHAHRERIHAELAERRYTHTLAAAVAAPLPVVVAEPDAGPEAAHNSATSDVSAMPTPRPGVQTRSRRFLITGAALLLLTFALAGSAAAVGSNAPMDSTWTQLTQHVTDHALPTASPEPMDGDDPRARDCFADAVVVQAVPLSLPGGASFGLLRLRHSDHCGASWGSAYYSNPQLYTIRITVHRPTDNAVVRDDWSNNTPPGSYSDMLSTGAGCVWVEAVVITPAGTSAPAKTSCSR